MVEDVGTTKRRATKAAGRPAPAAPAPTRSGVGLAILVVLLLLSGIAALGVVIGSYATVHPQVDPRTLPAGRVFVTTSTSLGASSTIACPSPRDWLVGAVDEPCRTGVRNNLGITTFGFLLLAFFAGLAVVYRLQSARRDAAGHASIGIGFVALLGTILVVPVVTVVSMAAYAAPGATFAVVVLAGVAFAAVRAIARGRAQAAARPPGPALGATTRLPPSRTRPLVRRDLWLLRPHPILLRSGRHEHDVAASLRRGRPDAEGGLDGSSWVELEDDGTGPTSVTVAEVNRQGRTHSFVYFDGVLRPRTDGAAGSELSGWLRRSLPGSVFGLLFPGLFVIVGAGRLIEQLRGRGPSDGSPTALLLLVGVVWLVAGEWWTAGIVRRLLRTLTDATGADPAVPEPRPPIPWSRHRTTAERLARRARLAGDFPRLRPAQAAPLLASATAASILVAGTLLILTRAI